MLKSKRAPQKKSVFAGPVMMRAQAKKTDQIHPLKVKEARSSVNKSTIEDLQKKDSTLKKCFDRVGKLIIRENSVECSSVDTIGPIASLREAGH